MDRVDTRARHQGAGKVTPPSRRGEERGEQSGKREREREKIGLLYASRTALTMERPSRRNASKAAKAEAATAGLKNLREKGLKRFDTVEVAEDNNVYDLVRASARVRPPLAGSSIRWTGLLVQKRAFNFPSFSNSCASYNHSPSHPSLTCAYSWISRLPQMTDEDYAAHVNKRRQEYGGFIVGEDGEECVTYPPGSLAAF